MANENDQAAQRPQNGQTGAEQLSSQQSTPAPSQGTPSQGAPSAELNQTLQEQLTQAIRPVVVDLQKQIAQSIRQQMSQGLHSTAKQAPQAAAPANNQAQPAGDQGQPTVAQPNTDLQAAIEKAVAAVRQAVDLIVRVAKQIYETVRAWLEKLMAAISGWIVSLIVSGLKSALQPLLKAAIGKGVDALGSSVGGKGKQVLRMAS